ncbi:aminotransferase class V-fold PLP-dependent enzyme [Streptomyces sp. URMC 126]|uniref:aminotransferase class V-fold PLP-dependent enzyme n=1 Tax=Streptomyces sp. URMC 126 TaxID=3423401 RepID=UPI003F1B130F
MADADWDDARGRMLLDPTAVNLNTGSGGPLPRVAFDRLTDLRARLARAPMDFLLREVPPLLWAARERLAGFLGGDPRRLVLTTNATAAVNLVASSLELPAPGEILLTDHEYPPMRWCWERAARRLGLGVRTVRLPRRPSGPGALLDAVVAAMGPRTRLLSFSHVLAGTGTVLPARELCEEARRRGITTVVDGAHAPGLLGLDLAAVPCDFYAGSGHKWLLGPTGTGFLHLGEGQADRLEPAQVSWAYRLPPGSPPDERDRFGSTPRLRRFECEGTRDLCPWLVLPESIGFQEELGPERIRARRRELAGRVRRLLADGPGLEPVTPASPELSAGMVAFRPPGPVPADELARRLWEDFRIETGVAERPDGALLRVSVNFHTTEAELDRLAEALGELTAGRAAAPAVSSASSAGPR